MCNYKVHGMPWNPKVDGLVLGMYFHDVEIYHQNSTNYSVIQNWNSKVIF